MTSFFALAARRVGRPSLLEASNAISMQSLPEARALVSPAAEFLRATRRSFVALLSTTIIPSSKENECRSFTIPGLMSKLSHAVDSSSSSPLSPPDLLIEGAKLRESFSTGGEGGGLSACMRNSALTKITQHFMALSTFEKVLVGTVAIAVIAGTVKYFFPFAEEQVAAHAAGDVCPITHEPFVDPVVTADGHTYERWAIERWFEDGNFTSPLTNLPLSSRRLAPNVALRLALGTA